MTTYGDGVFQYGGMPTTPLGVSIPATSNSQTGGGMVFFVDAANGADGNDGLSVLRPMATIQRAMNQATDGTGCTIFVFPGTYNENVTCSKDYVSLVGCIVGGYARPDIVPDTGVPLTVTGQGFTASHCRFGATAADCVVQQGNGFRYTDCVFDGDGTASKAGVRLLPSSTDDHLTASEGLIAGNLFRGSAIGLAFDTGAAPVGVGSTDNLIEGNTFRANTLDIAAEKTGAGGAYSVQVTQIGPGNTFADKNKTTYIDITTNEDGSAGSQTGTIEGNWFAADAINSTRVKMVGTGFTFVGNYDTVGLVDGSGLD